MLYCVQDLGCGVGGGDFRVGVKGLDGGESSRENHKAGKEDPSEE